MNGICFPKVEFLVGDRSTHHLSCCDVGPSVRAAPSALGCSVRCRCDVRSLATASEVVDFCLTTPALRSLDGTGRGNQQGIVARTVFSRGKLLSFAVVANSQCFETHEAGNFGACYSAFNFFSLRNVCASKRAGGEAHKF